MVVLFGTVLDPIPINLVLSYSSQLIIKTISNTIGIDVLLAESNGQLAPQSRQNNPLQWKLTNVPGFMFDMIQSQWSWTVISKFSFIPVLSLGEQVKPSQAGGNLAATPETL